MEPDLMGDQELGERLLLQGEGDSHPNHPTLTQVGEKQPHQYRDVWAAVLFGGGQCVIFYLGCFWGLPNLQYTASTTTDTTETIRFSGLLYISLLSGLAAVLLSGGALAILVRMAHQLIEMSIYFSIFTCSVTTVFLFATGMLTMGCASLLVLVFTVVYAWSVWRRIPFATANLQTAVAAIQNNQGLILTGYVVSMVVTLLNMIWVLAYVGVYVRSASCSDNECTSHTHPMVVTSMLLMFFWSTEVAKNILHVTVSGVVGTFWFAPEEASGFFSPAVTDSLTRACTFSLGSVCLGSLLTAILQVLHQLANQARLRGRGNDLLLCVLECLVGFLERLIAYFNKWAYGTFHGFLFFLSTRIRNCSPQIFSCTDLWLLLSSSFPSVHWSLRLRLLDGW